MCRDDDDGGGAAYCIIGPHRGGGTRCCHSAAAEGAGAAESAKRRLRLIDRNRHRRMHAHVAITFKQRTCYVRKSATGRQTKQRSTAFRERERASRRDDAAAAVAVIASRDVLGKRNAKPYPFPPERGGPVHAKRDFRTL